MAKAKAPTGLHIVVERAALLKALTATTKAVETRNTYPILANVLLTATEDRLQVRASDTDVEITSSCPATCSPGETTVPGKMLLDIVRKLPDGSEVTLDVDETHMTIKVGRSRYKLGTTSADSFPEMEFGAAGTPFEIDLASLFAPIAFAISDEATRYYLNGIFLHNPGSNLTAVATDGHRLGKHIATSVGDIPAVIVPRKTVGLVPPGVVTVEINDTKIRITSGDTVMVSKLIEGTFPDYARVIPKNNEKIVELDRAQFAAAVDRVGTVASETGGKAVKVSVKDDGDIELTVTHPDHGESSEGLAANAEIGAFDIGYNTRYLSDILSHLGGSVARFAWNDAGSPSLITGDNDNLSFTLMPMRVA